jgi:hypothetical protein
VGFFWEDILESLIIYLVYKSTAILIDIQRLSGANVQDCVNLGWDIVLVSRWPMRFREALRNVDGTSARVTKMTERR